MLLQKLDKSYLKLLSNFFFLSFSQGITFLLPLLLTPFLIKLIGVESYAIVMFSQAIMSYFTVFCDFGFNITATHLCSIHRDNKDKLIEIISEVLITKFFLLLIGFVLLLGVTLSFSYFENIRLLILLSYSIVIGKVIYPVWFFQGIEKMVKVALFSICSKLILILAFIYLSSLSKSSVFVYANLVYAIGDIVIGIVSIIFIRFIYLKKKFVSISIKTVICHVNEDFSVFFTNFANNIYLNSNIIILSLFANNKIVGYYAIAEKVMIALKQIASVVLQATYPYACRVASESLLRLKFFLRMQFFSFAGLFTIVGALCFVFSDRITLLMLRNPQEEISNYIKCLSFIPLIVSLNMSAYQILLIYKVKFGYSSIIISGSLLNILLNFMLSPYFMANGTIISIIVTELFVTIGLNLIIILKFPKYRFL